VIAMPLAKRAAPALAAVAAGAAIGFLVGRRNRHRPTGPKGAVLAEDLQAALLRLLS
jgi:hypothetical protein